MMAMTGRKRLHGGIDDFNEALGEATRAEALHWVAQASAYGKRHKAFGRGLRNFRCPMCPTKVTTKKTI